MRSRLIILAFTAVLSAIGIHCNCQDSISAGNFPSAYLEQVGSRAVMLERHIDKTSEKVLAKLQRQEEKIKRKLSKIDSLAAKNIFSDADQQYKKLEQKLQQTTRLNQYIPYLDTLKTSFKFLEENQQLMASAKDAQQQIKETVTKLNGLESRFQKAEEIKIFLKERKKFLKEQLGKFGFGKELKKINKEAYYYSAQLNEYKEILKDKKKIERKAIELLSKTKVFQDFMRKNSILAGIFRMPGNGDPNDPAYLANLAGLQTRVQVTQLVQQQIGAAGPNAMQQLQQNIQSAQGQLQQLKDKASQLANSGDDTELPDFRPNNQKTKSFLKRLEYGANIQSAKATSLFPITSDIGLSLGYKLNDKSIIGVGASYKIGLGTGWNNIKLTHQGIGLRSYIDYKLKGSFFISGGYEQNYKNEIRSVDVLKDYSAWQSSGLLGISKKYQASKKFRGSMQLLWDFLSYQQVPRTQPILFRIGYSLK